MPSISDALVRELEAQARSAKGEKARALKENEIIVIAILADARTR